MSPASRPDARNCLNSLPPESPPPLRRLLTHPVAQTDGSFGQASLQGSETSGNVLNRSLRCFLPHAAFDPGKAHTDSWTAPIRILVSVARPGVLVPRACMRLFVCPRFTLSLSGTHTLRSLLRSLRYVLPSEGVAVSVSYCCIARGKAHTGPETRQFIVRGTSTPGGRHEIVKRRKASLCDCRKIRRTIKLVFAGVRRYEEPQSKILQWPEDIYGPRNEFQVRDGGRGTVSVGGNIHLACFTPTPQKSVGRFFHFLVFRLRLGRFL